MKDYDLYNPVLRNMFYCLQSGEAIPIERLNDDYCDCEEDGSDEPETNACKSGVFYCSMTHQKRCADSIIIIIVIVIVFVCSKFIEYSLLLSYLIRIRYLTGRGRDNSVPSSRINDGVCDCCEYDKIK